jgi:hypothetical protein
MPLRPGRVIAVAAMIAAGFGVYNVLADNSAVERLARAEACKGRGPQCAPAMIKLMRTPFFQKLQFRVQRETVEVRCARSLYLIGDYACSALRPG